MPHLPNIMQRGANLLAAKMKPSAGKQVIYCRGQLKSNTITAWVDGQGDGLEDQDDFSTKFTWRTWTFVTAEILINGKLIEPQPGDRIEEKVGSKTRIYEVMQLSGEPESGDFDTSNKMTKVHTKRVA